MYSLYMDIKAKHTENQEKMNRKLHSSESRKIDVPEPSPEDITSEKNDHIQVIVQEGPVTSGEEVVNYPLRGTTPALRKAIAANMKEKPLFTKTSDRSVSKSPVTKMNEL